MSIAHLKRQSAANFEKLNEELVKLNSPNNDRSADTRFWKPTVDKAGNAYAVIRFLPQIESEDVPFVRMWSHAFQGPKGLWYIENSRTTLGGEESDPVSEHNKLLWNSGIESNKKLVSDHRKRKLHYFSNILVEKDPSNPEAEGKVFLYKYGKKIYDKINDQMHPPFPDKEKYNPFDVFDGAPFSLRQRKADGYPNFDASTFEGRCPIGTDEKILEVYSQVYALKPLVAQDQFKDYDTLNRRLLKVLDTGSGQVEPSRQSSSDDAPPWASESPAAKIKERSARPAPAAAAAQMGGVDDEDDEMALFRKLADD